MRKKNPEGVATVQITQSDIRWGIAVPALFASLVATLAPLVQPYFLNKLISVQDVSSLVTVGTILMVTLSLGALATAIEKYLFGVVGEEIACTIRKRLIYRISISSIFSIEQLPKGDLSSRMGGEVNQLKATFSQGYLPLPKGITLIVGSAFFMAWLDITLFLVVCAVLFSVSLAFSMYSKALNSHSRIYQESTGDFASALVHFIEGFRPLKIANATRSYVKRLDNAVLTIKTAGKKLSRVEGVTGGLTIFTLQLALLAVLAFGGIRVANDLLPLEDLISFVLYLSISTTAFGDLFGSVTAIRKGRSIFERTEMINNIPRERSTGKQLPPGHYTIRFDEVSFSYEQLGDGVSVLSNVTFEVEEGTTVVIVGPSGAGKSTIFAALLGIVEPQGGCISVGDVRTSDLKLSDLRQLFAYADQNATILADTVSENLRVGNPLATDLELQDALEIVGLMDRFNDDGLHTFLGEGGSTLSGGQRQRLVLARALLSQNPILLLDEPTSALDGESENRILNSGLLNNRRTKLIITHRLSVAKHADSVVVLKQGKVEAVGTHEKLLRESEFYRSLWSREHD